MKKLNEVELRVSIVEEQGLKTKTERIETRIYNDYGKVSVYGIVLDELEEIIEKYSLGSMIIYEDLLDALSNLFASNAETFEGVQTIMDIFNEYQEGRKELNWEIGMANIFIEGNGNTWVAFQTFEELCKKLTEIEWGNMKISISTKPIDD